MGHIMDILPITRLEFSDRMEDGILIHALRKGWNSGTAGLNAGIVQVSRLIHLIQVTPYLTLLGRW